MLIKLVLQFNKCSLRAAISSFSRSSLKIRGAREMTAGNKVTKGTPDDSPGSAHIPRSHFLIFEITYTIGLSC